MFTSALGSVGSAISESEFVKSHSTSLLTLAGVVIGVAGTRLFQHCQPRWGETWFDLIGRVALKIPMVKRIYDDKIRKALLTEQKKIQEAWAKFGDPYTEIPPQGLTLSELKAFVDNLVNVTNAGLEGNHYSGVLYSNVHKKPEQRSDSKAVTLEVAVDYTQMTLKETLDRLTAKNNEAIEYAFSLTKSGNSLHQEVFPVGPYIEYMASRMMAKMFGCESTDFLGFATSGGTESLMTAMRAYRNWGIEKRGHRPGEGVVIVCNSVHAAVLKAEKAFFINVIQVEPDATGRVDITKLRDVVKQYGNQVVAIVGSAPSYPKGVVDPLTEIGEIAQEYGVGFHVDCCLGAYVVNYISDKGQFLNLPGVTSASGDPHKFGGALIKGISIGLMGRLQGELLAEHAFYSIPDSKCGVYGSPGDAGSKPYFPVLAALLAMLGIGKDCYMRIAQEVHKKAKELAEVIGEFPNQLKLVVDPEVSVVAFQIDPAWGLLENASYYFAEKMKEHHIVLNPIADDMVHFCVTPPFAADENALNVFREAIKLSLDETKQMSESLRSEGEKFPGLAGTYSSIQCAFDPSLSKQSWFDFISNMFLGKMGAEYAVKRNFTLLKNPFMKL